MATAIPALQGKFGETEYFLSTMNIGELLRSARFPKDIPDWDDLSVEEKWQRDLNLNRVRKEIAPYFATDDKRFSSALVLAVLNHEGMEFESLQNFGGNANRNVVPQLYRTAAKNMGFLTLSGNEILVPLDGQHRVKAFQYAIDGTDDNKRAIAGIKSNTDLANDQIAIILVRHQENDSRRIFNKINRYAKPTTKSDNLITDDDDPVAVITRELAREDGVIPSRLVRIGANTLPHNAPEFTTLATFYEANRAIILGLKFPGATKLQQMPVEQRELVKEQLQDQWERLLSRIDLWDKALSDTSIQGDATRIEIRDQTLLGKPVGQLSLVRGFMLMRERCEGVLESELCNRLNQISWDVNAEMWRGVLMNQSGRVMAGSTTVNRAALFIAHLGGAQLKDEEKDMLLEHIHGLDWEQHQLPTPVV